MRIRPLRIGALFLALIVTWAPASGRTAEFPLGDTPVVPDGLGVNIHFTDPPAGEMAMLAAGGFRWVRMDLAWSGTERQKGIYDFSAFDRLMTALEPHGIRPLFILDYANRHYDDGQSPRSDQGRQAFARWAAAAVQHFRGRGILWEMYNEPNIHFWRPEPNPEHYVLLALEVGKAIRAAAPDEIYIGPATSGVDFDFLETCFRAGLLDYWSAVSVHPYRQQAPESAAGDYARLRQLIARYAPARKRIPILSAEWGYSAVWKGMDTERQGKLLPRQWLTNLANHIPVSIWYDWHDDGRDPQEPEHHFGTVRHPYRAGSDPVYEAKPAYEAARALTAQLAGFRFNKRLDLGSRDDYVLLFSQRDQVRLAVWTTATEPCRVLIPASPGSFAVTGHTGQELAEATAVDGGLSLILSDAPQYLTPRAANPLLQVAAAWQAAPLDLTVPAQRGHALTLTVANPLEHPIHVRSQSGSLMETPVGGRARLEQRFDVDRRQDVQNVRLECVIQELGTIAQLLPVMAADPLEVACYPATERCFSVRLGNPSARPFAASLRLTDVSGLQLSAHELSFDFGADQTQQLVHFSLKEPPAGEYRVGVAIEDAGPALTVPASTYRRVDDFSHYSPETLARAYSIVPDGDGKVASQQRVALAAPPEGPPLPGAGTLRITYRFDTGWKFARLVPRSETLQEIAGRPRAVSMWIYGDGSRNHPRLRITDATGQTFQPSGKRLDWTGWGYVEFPLDDKQMGHWGGADDGVVHFPIRWDTLLLIDSAERKETTGEIYLACPTLIE